MGFNNRNLSHKTLEDGALSKKVTISYYENIGEYRREGIITYLEDHSLRPISSDRVNTILPVKKIKRSMIVLYMAH